MSDLSDEKEEYERILEAEREAVEAELTAINAELLDSYSKVAAAIESMDKKIGEAYESGDEPLWNSLTIQREMLLTRSAELGFVMRK